MEEDIIFGKKRHFFGGIEPSNMLEFAAYLKNGVVHIKAKLPKDTIIDGQTICSVGGAVIRRKTGSYPVDEFDGDEVANITSDSTIIDDEADTSVDQYYAAFPYSKLDVYNRSNANRAKFLSGAQYYIFGYDLYINESDPDTRVVYPSDVDNYGYTPVQIQSDKTMNYGSWPSTPGQFFMPRPCMLDYSNGTVYQYLDPSDYSKTVSGKDSTVSEIGYTLNAMMEWPKIYTHREEVNGVYKFRCSDVPWGDDWDCWCNYDKNDNVVDHFYTSIYPSTYHSNRLRSISDRDTTTYVCTNSSLSNLMDKAAKNGEGWTLETVGERLLITDLLVMMAKSTDCQSSYGNGRNETSTSPSLKSGVLDQTGLFYGNTSGDSDMIKVFGMENWWGYYDRRIVGAIMARGSLKIKITSGCRDGSSVVGYNTTGDGYIPIQTFTTTINSYVKTTKNTEFGRIPNGGDGSSTTYECDYVVYNQAVVSSGLIITDGTTTAGPFAFNFNTSVDSTGSILNAGLSYRPIAENS